MVTIEEFLDVYSAEVATVSRSFFIWKNINNIASKDPDIFEAINGNAYTWNVILNSLQSTFFMALGRIFDIDKDAFSIHTLLRLCIENIDQFNLDSLRKRKIRISRSENLEWLEGYLKNAYEPKEVDFQRIRGEVSKINKLYEEIYKPIRHKVYAHVEKDAIGKTSELFEKTNIAEIQSIIEFTFQVERVLWELLFNGRLNTLSDFKLSEEQDAQKDVNVLLQKLKT